MPPGLFAFFGAELLRQELEETEEEPSFTELVHDHLHSQAVFLGRRHDSCFNSLICLAGPRTC